MAQLQLHGQGDDHGVYGGQDDEVDDGGLLYVDDALLMIHRDGLAYAGAQFCRRKHPKIVPMRKKNNYY